MAEYDREKVLDAFFQAMSSTDDEPFFGVDRSGPVARFDRPAEPEPPRALLDRVRDAWAGLLAGWRGEVGE